MSNQITNIFQSYSFPDEREYAESYIFNSLNLQRIQTLAAAVAENILALNYDSQNPHDFGIQQSFLRGQLEAYKHLLVACEESQSALLQLSNRGE